MRDMVFGADAMGKGVNIAGQLGVDGMAAVHGRPAHSQTCLNVFWILHDGRKVLQNQLYAFFGKSRVRFVYLYIAHCTFDAVAESIHAAGCRHLLGRVDGKFAVENHMRDIEAYQHRGAFCPARVGYHCAYSDFCACASRGGHGDDWQSLVGNG